MKNMSNSRRPEGKCGSGLHDWTPANIYTAPDGRQYCRPCRIRRDVRFADLRRKHPIVEPEVETVPRRARTTTAAHVARDFWVRLVARLALLSDREELRVQFPPTLVYQPRCSGVQRAAAAAGIAVGTEWVLSERCLYVWLVRRNRRAAA